MEGLGSVVEWAAPCLVSVARRSWYSDSLACSCFVALVVSFVFCAWLAALVQIGLCVRLMSLLSKVVLIYGRPWTGLVARFFLPLNVCS